jgi:hypothetical protein
VWSSTVGGMGAFWWTWPLHRASSCCSRPQPGLCCLGFASSDSSKGVLGVPWGVAHCRVCVGDANAAPVPSLPRPSATLQPPLAPTVPVGDVPDRAQQHRWGDGGRSIDAALEKGLQQLHRAPAPLMAAGPGRWQQQRQWAGGPALAAIAPPASLCQGLLSAAADADITVITPVHARPPPFSVNSFVVRLGGLPAEPGVVVGRHPQLHVPCVLWVSGTVEVLDSAAALSHVQLLSPPPNHDVRHRLTLLLHTLRARGFWRLADWSPPWRELGFPPSASQPTLEPVAGQKRRRRRSIMRSSQQLRLCCGVAAVEEAGIDFEAASYDVSEDEPVGDSTQPLLGGASQ